MSHKSTEGYMDAIISSQLMQVLHSRRDVIANHWYHAIAPTGCVSQSASQVRQRLADLTEQIITWVFTDPLDRDAARSIGVALARLHYIQPQSLSATQETLTQQLVAELPAEQAMPLYLRLSTLLSELAAGFSAQTIETLLAEQERVREALIAERTQAEEKLHEAESRYRTLIEQISAITYEQGLVVEWNRGQEQITGLKRDSVVGRTIWDVLRQITSDESQDPAVHERDKAAFTELLGTGQAPRLHWLTQYDILHPAGTRRTVQTVLFPIQTKNGFMAGATTHDITVQRQIEELQIRRAQEMDALYKTSLEINSHSDVPTLLQAIVQRAAKLVGTQMGGLYLMKPDGQTLELVVNYNLPGDYLGAPLRLGEELSRRVAQAGKPMAIDDCLQWEGRATAYPNAPVHRVLAAPLKVGDRVMGVILVNQDKKTGPRSEDEIRLVSLFADQAAIAIENARLYQAERDHCDLAETLREVGATLVSTLDTNAVLNRILEQISRVAPNDAADIMLIKGDRAHFAGWRGYERFGIEDLTGVTFSVADTRNLQHMVETGEPVVIPDVYADPDWLHLPGIERLRSYAGVPICVRGKTIGFLAVYSVAMGHFEWTDAERLRAFANQAAIAIENARLYQAEREQHELAETMCEISAALASTLDMDIVLDRLLANISRVVPNDAADIMLVEGDRARFVRWRGYERFGIQDLTDMTFLVADRPALQQMITTCGPVFVSDIQTDPGWDYPPNMDWQRSYAGTPICVQGEPIGFLDVMSTQPGAFGQMHAERLRAFADQAAIALENAQLFVQVRDTASRLQAMSHRLVEAQETERRYIARELHDEIGQIVTSLKLRLEMCSRLSDDALRSSLAQAEDLVHELLERVRALSLDLRPAMLDDLGLLPAILWLLDHFTKETSVGVTFKHSEIEQRHFSSEVETTAYRIVQEALTNVVRHAGASAVTVRLWATQDTLGIQVEDDGAGFNPETVLSSGSSMGLSSMRERAALLDGNLEIESLSGKGTRLTAELPLDHLV